MNCFGMLLLLICFVSLSHVAHTAWPEVSVAQGVLRGKQETSWNGKLFYRFSGIPYAKAPVGILRFKDPKPPEKWDNIRDASKEGDSCRSRHMVTMEYIGSEDCLFLNVYTPRHNDTNSSPLPVAFWIHGGSFYMGSGASYRYGADWFMDEDVVLVTINYRLGPLGFLNMHLEEAPGNAGLKDQVAALRWVNENIRAFGGNPDNITIFGESAGGSSVHYLLLSDITEGLFQRAIIQSGTALNNWAFESDPKTRAWELCKQLNYTGNTSDPKEALKFLLNASAEDLMEVSEKVAPIEYYERFSDIAFGPSIETVFPKQQSFLTEHPSQRMKSGKFLKIPIMVGYTDGEGIMLLKTFEDEPELYDSINKKFDIFVPLDMNDKTAAGKIKQFYFGDQPVSPKQQDALVDLVGDFVLITKIGTMAKIHANLSDQPVYFYRFAFDELSYYKALFGLNNVKRACHADELLYLFTNNILPFPNSPGSNVDKTQRRMIKLWTNFIKTGNPTPKTTDLLPVKWEHMRKDKMYYLSIGEELELGVDPDKIRLEFWEKLYNPGSIINNSKSILIFAIFIPFSLNYLYINY